MCLWVLDKTVKLLRPLRGALLYLFIMKPKLSKKQNYINFINKSEMMQNWLKNAPSQLLDYDVVRDQNDGLFRIRILLKNAYRFDDD